jgi:peptidoglycan/xylan/chitin deacetylase (PgdA/CDA1 family)
MDDEQPGQPPLDPAEARARRRAAWARRRRRRRRVGAAAVAAVVVVAAGAVALARLPSGGDGPAVARGAGHQAPARTAAHRTTSAPAAPAPPPFARLRYPAAPARASVRVPVLMFHRVASEATVTNAVSADLTVTPARFAAQMDWLARNGYRPISQTTLFRALYEGGPLPRRPVVLTFDDGYVDAVDTIQPILARHGWPATFAVITGRAGAAAFLTWSQIRALDRDGMDIASHSVDHVDLAGAGAADLQRELAGSRRALEAHLGHPVYWFVYPAGSYDAAAEQAARAAGYLLAYTTDPGSLITADGAMAEPRVRVHGADTVADFAAAVRGASAG